MNINIKDILEKHGFEIVKQVDYKYLTLRFNEDKLESIKEAYEKDQYDYDIYADFDVGVAEVGFNGYGNLYIVLNSLGDKNFEKGDCFDVIEY